MPMPTHLQVFEILFNFPLLLSLSLSLYIYIKFSEKGVEIDKNFAPKILAEERTKEAIWSKLFWQNSSQECILYEFHGLNKCMKLFLTIMILICRDKNFCYAFFADSTHSLRRVYSFLTLFSRFFLVCFSCFQLFQNVQS